MKWKSWVKKHLWNIAFYLALGCVLFVPSIRMSVISTVQRIFSFAPSSLPVEEQKMVSNFNWTFYDLNDNPVSFNQSKGKVIVINFWATWCPPCIAEMPSFQKVYNQFKSKVDFYFISMESSEKLNKFIKENEYSLPFYRMLESPSNSLDYNSLPTTFVIDKQGVILIKEVGAQDWNSSSFKELLEKKIIEYD